jgi:hypothetical protein
MATKATITFDLAPEDFDCIIDMAGYGVGYWASAMESTDTGCHFTDAGRGKRKKYFVTPAMVEKAALDLYVNSPLNDYYHKAIRQLVIRGDGSDVGSDIADAIIQQACFGQVIYG